MAVLLGLAAAVSYAAADFLGGLLSRRTGVLPVVVLSQLASLVVLTAALAATGFGPPTARGLGWGALSGVAAGVGLLLYFRGLTLGKMSVVAPTTAVVGAAVPALVGLALGERPTTAALIGIGIAVVAVALVSLVPERAVQPGGVVVGVDVHDIDVHPEQATRPGTPGLPGVSGVQTPGLLEAVSSGVVFGLFFVFLNQAGPGGAGASGPLWPLLAATVGSLGPIGVAVAVRRRSLRPAAGTWFAIVASGVFGSAGSLLFLLGAQRGLLSLTAVLASLSPAGTVLLARTVLGERLRAVQLAGLVCAVAGAALIGAS